MSECHRCGKEIKPGEHTLCVLCDWKLSQEMKEEYARKILTEIIDEFEEYQGTGFIKDGLDYGITIIKRHMINNKLL